MPKNHEISIHTPDGLPPAVLDVGETLTTDEQGRSYITSADGRRRRRVSVRGVVHLAPR